MKILRGLVFVVVGYFCFKNILSCPFALSCEKIRKQKRGTGKQGKGRETGAGHKLPSYTPNQHTQFLIEYRLIIQ